MNPSDWKGIGRVFALLGILVAILSPGSAAVAAVDGGRQAPATADTVEVEFGEGVPDGIPPQLLREQESALRRSPAGREWLRTPEGRAHAAEVAKVLRRRSGDVGLTSAGPGTSVDPGGGGGCDYDCFNGPDQPTEGEAGGADGYAYYGGCKQPYVVAKHRNPFGQELWRYYQQVYWCWNGGVISYVYRTRWPWVSGHWLNGWSFHGHQSTNCYTETCHGHWVGFSWARYWTQGKFEVCHLKWIGCRGKYPLVGIDVNGWGGWGGWLA